MGDESVGQSVVPRARWFISAGTDVDLSGLISDLRRRGAEPYILSDVAELGADVLQSVSRAIGEADNVLLVLGSGSVSSNVWFEAGIAVGLGKPVLVVADPDIKLPFALAGVLTVRARPNDL
jgi:predicted nucleotide-binding protein